MIWQYACVINLTPGSGRWGHRGPDFSHPLKPPLVNSAQLCCTVS